jgi:hypothetical protein
MAAMKYFYTTTEARTLGGVTVAQLEHLVRTGAVVPADYGHRGRGCSRKFSAVNLVQIAVAADLLAHGVPVRVIRLTSESLRTVLSNHTPAELKQRVLIIERGAPSAEYGPFVSREYLHINDLDAWTRSGKSGVVINLPAILDRIEAVIQGHA